MHHDSQPRGSSKQWRDPNEQAWVHWEYDPEEWAVFDRVDWRGIWLRYWLLNLAPPICIFVLGIVSAPNNLFGVLMGALVFGLIIAAVLYAVRRPAYLEAKKRHQARQNPQNPRRVTFSKEAIWEAGTHFPLTGVFLTLKKVRMTSQPAVLHFHRKELVGNMGGNGYVRDTLHVLVPRGHEEEAVQLMERFRTEVIEVKKPTYSPPEPA